ncbi:hypothetical protein SK128_006330, partial [Halocaridina rubra]
MAAASNLHPKTDILHLKDEFNPRGHPKHWRLLPRSRLQLKKNPEEAFYIVALCVARLILMERKAIFMTRTKT